MTVVTVPSPGGLIELDPSDSRVVQFDFDENLDAAAAITSNTFTITAIRQTGATALTKDNETLTGSNRKTQCRLIATTATLGDIYELASKIVTNESPTQTKEKSVRIVIQNQ